MGRTLHRVVHHAVLYVMQHAVHHVLNHVVSRSSPCPSEWAVSRVAGGFSDSETSWVLAGGAEGSFLCSLSSRFSGRGGGVGSLPRSWRRVGVAKFEFFWCPSPGGRSVREITGREETERPPEESARQIPACSKLSSRSPGACQICSGAVRSAEPDLQRAPGGTELCRSPRSPPGHDLRLDEHGAG